MKSTEKFWRFRKKHYLCIRNRETADEYQKPKAEVAEIAQLVEHNLAKVRVASSSLVFRSRKKSCA